MTFGYLPQSDLETGNLRTEHQVRDAIKTLQVNNTTKPRGWSTRLFLFKIYSVKKNDGHMINLYIFFMETKFIFLKKQIIINRLDACVFTYEPTLRLRMSFISFSF